MHKKKGISWFCCWHKNCQKSFGSFPPLKGSKKSIFSDLHALCVLQKVIEEYIFEKHLGFFFVVFFFGISLRRKRNMHSLGVHWGFFSWCAHANWAGSPLTVCFFPNACAAGCCRTRCHIPFMPRMLNWQTDDSHNEHPVDVAHKAGGGENSSDSWRNGHHAHFPPYIQSKTIDIFKITHHSGYHRVNGRNGKKIWLLLSPRWLSVKRSTAHTHIYFDAICGITHP